MQISFCILFLIVYIERQKIKRKKYILVSRRKILEARENMIDSICLKLTKIIQKNVPDIDDERAEIINYGLQNIIGELPKIFPIMFVAYLLGIFKLTMIACAVILIYRIFSGGFHLSTHLGCIICSISFLCGTVFLSKYLVISNYYLKIIIYLIIWLINMVIIKLYAPADTENVPIIDKKQRRKQQIESYIVMSLIILSAIFLIKDSVIQNIFVYGTFLQSLGMTRIAYKITNNKYRS